MNGTSIQDLMAMQVGSGALGQVQYNAMQNHQYEQGHNAAHQVQQAQHAPYYGIDPNYPQYLPQPGGVPASPGSDSMMPVDPSLSMTMPQMPPMTSHMSMQEIQPELPDIEDLARDISDNLPDDIIVSRVSEEPEEMDEPVKKSRGGYLSKVPEMLREPLIIVALYIILSQPQIRDNIAKYITQLNPDSQGQTALAGVVIYGIILAVLYGVSKRVLLR